jgi:poly(3-hydroxyalkanoate) synthetase
MYEPSGRHFPYAAYLWPALAAASASDFVASVAKQFVDLAVGSPGDVAAPEPAWETPNAIALDLQTVRLRDFTTSSDGIPTLVCTPFALHSSTVADLAPGHSLVAALRAAGLSRLFVTDWRSANEEMRYLGIDDYLADLNVLVDHLGGSVNLIGLCQGGWMALLYAARFPAKVGKVVMAGAPIDITAARSGLSTVAESSPLTVFQELVKIGDGRVLGRSMLQFWGSEFIDADEAHQLLETPEPVGSPAFATLEALFQIWYAWTVDLPGRFYLEIVEKLYKHNDLAGGRFVALGQTIDLKKVRTPLFLLAARDDEVVAPAQLFAAKHLVGTPAECVDTALAPCRHIGLFIGRAVIEEFWPKVARWLLEPGSIAPQIAEPTPHALGASEPACVPAPHLIP